MQWATVGDDLSPQVFFFRQMMLLFFLTLYHIIIHARRYSDMKDYPSATCGILQEQVLLL